MIDLNSTHIEEVLYNQNKYSEIVFIYTNNKTNRLNYTCDFIFNTVLNCHYEIINNLEEFERKQGVKINYSSTLHSKCINVPEHPFLNNACPIRKQMSLEIESNGSFVLFRKQLTDYDLNFDIFSAVFACISRYEEWINPKFDEHKRFEIEQSIFFNSNYHLTPQVDKWIHQLREALIAKFKCNLPLQPFKQISTVDLDNLYAFQHKGFIRNLGGGFKDLLKGKFGLIAKRMSVCLGMSRDPFDVYDLLIEHAKDNQLELVFFYLLNDKTKFDRTLNPYTKGFKKNIDQVCSKCKVGLHPSYYAYNNSELLKQEAELFKQLTNEPVQLSRQHYLRFDIKLTPGLLEKNCIKYDFTMGFAGKPGFRAGTSFPFPYFNFESNQSLNIVAVPFCAMDGAYSVYKAFDYSSTLKSLNELRSEVKKVGGFFITVFHERSFSKLHYGRMNELYFELFRKP